MEELARSVAEIEGHPIDAAECVVLLEILGVQNAEASRLGFLNLFALGQAVRPLVPAYSGRSQGITRRPMFRTRVSAGFLYNGNWVAMVVALLVGGQSLWAARGLPQDLSLALILAVATAFISTGGIQQFAANKMTYYRMQRNEPLERYVMARSLRLGLLLAGAALGTAVLLAVRFFGLPSRSVAVLVSFGALVACYRLLLVPVLSRKGFLEMVLPPVGATVVMYVAYWLLLFVADRTEAVILSQLLGLVLLVGVSALRTRPRTQRVSSPAGEEPPFYARPDDGPQEVNPPQFWALLAGGLPQLIYGTVFFVFLYTDRMLWWWHSAGGGYLLAYSYRYQLAMDLALLLLIPITIVKYLLVETMSDRLAELAEQTHLTNERAFGASVWRFIKSVQVKGSIAIFAICAAASVSSEGLVTFAGGDAEAAWVFRLALWGILFFSIFLTNAMLGMNLNWTLQLAGLLGLAVLCDAFVGAYAMAEYGASGLVAGFVAAAAFLAVSSTLLLHSRRDKILHAYFANH